MLMNAQVALIPVLSTAPTPLDHTHVAVTQATSSMKMDFTVMVSSDNQNDGRSKGVGEVTAAPNLQYQCPYSGCYIQLTNPKLPQLFTTPKH